jgi:hypothetical protein
LWEPREGDAAPQTQSFIDYAARFVALFQKRRLSFPKWNQSTAVPTAELDFS